MGAKKGNQRAVRFDWKVENYATAMGLELSNSCTQVLIFEISLESSLEEISLEIPLELSNYLIMKLPTPTQSYDFTTLCTAVELESNPTNSQHSISQMQLQL